MPDYAVAAGGRVHVVRVEDDVEGLRVSLGGRLYPVRLDPWVGSTHFRFGTGGEVHPVVIRRSGEDVIVTVHEEQYRWRVGPAVPIARRAGPAGSTAAREVTAPMPGLVVSVQVAEGETVEQGRAVAVMEAMKMQSELRAPISGKVTAVNVQAGQEVGAGTALMTITPAGSGIAHGTQTEVRNR